MKFNRDNKYFKWGMTAFLVIAASMAFYYLLFLGPQLKVGLDAAWEIMMPIIFGFILAYLLTPILNKIERKILVPFFDLLKIKSSRKRNGFIRGIGIFLTVVLFIAVVYSLSYMMLSQIVPSLTNLISNFDTYYANFIKWINTILDNNPELGDYVIRLVENYSEELEEWLNESVLAMSGEVIKTVSLSIISIAKSLLNIIIGLLISIYLMTSKEKFAGQTKKSIYAMFQEDTANTIVQNFRFTHRTFIGFVGGKIVDSLIIGILCFIGTSILKTPYAALVSVIVGATNVIPYFGPFIGAIPSIILIFVVDPMHPLNAVYFAIFILALQQFDGNILGPKILGEYTGLSSFWVIFSITIFGGLWGVVGMIIGVPLFAVIYAAAKSIIYRRLQRKNMPEGTEEYVNLEYVSKCEFHEYSRNATEKNNTTDKNPTSFTLKTKATNKNENSKDENSKKN